MIDWVLYSLAVGGLIALAARGSEEVCGLLRIPTRWGWAAGLLAILALMATATSRIPGEPMAGGPVTFPLAEPVAVLAPPVAELGPEIAMATPGVLAALTAVPLARASAEIRTVTGNRWDRVFVGVWIGLSALLSLGWLWTAFLVRRIRRESPVVRLQGMPVRVTPFSGPAVMGGVRPEIVIPRWLSWAPHDEQRLILTHEREHIRARDPLFLLFGCLVVALVPWHPALWWMAARMRLATEIDCDARVLRSGVEPLGYGSLLIASARRSSGSRLSTHALGVSSSSHLERRLIAMTPIRRRFAAGRGSLVAAGAAAAVLVACEASLPTAGEIEAMDVAAVEAAAARLGIDENLAGAQYLVDGVEVSVEDARAIPADRIASIEVAAADSATPFRYEVAMLARPRNNPGQSPPQHEVTIIMMDRVADTGAEAAIVIGQDRLTADSLRLQMSSNLLQGVQTRGDVLLAARGLRPSSSAQTVQVPPLILIDGVRSDAAAVTALGRTSTLKTIHVIKAAEAVQRYGPEAAGGALVITTD